MPSAANSAKARWNAANYVQIKVHVYPDVADAFKAACINAGVSMASVLSRCMSDYSSVAANLKAEKKAAGDTVSTKKMRSNTIRKIVHTLEQVRDAEEQAMENTPENLRGSEKYESYEERISSMDDALAILEGLY